MKKFKLEINKNVVIIDLVTGQKHYEKIRKIGRVFFHTDSYRFRKSDFVEDRKWFSGRAEIYESDRAYSYHIRMTDYRKDIASKLDKLSDDQIDELYQCFREIESDSLPF